MPQSRNLKIFFYVSDLVGPQNACIGLAQELRSRGHQVMFFAGPEHGNKFARYGFAQLTLRREEADAEKETPIKEYIASLIDIGFLSDKSPLEKLDGFEKFEFGPKLVAKCSVYEPQLREWLKMEKPDVLVVDSEVLPPIIMNAGIPWVYLYCSNPIGFFDSDKLPPFTSDFPTTSDPATWTEFKAKLHKSLSDVVAWQGKICEEFNYPLPSLKTLFAPKSPYLNLYQFPEELDYHELIDLPENYRRVDAFCREETGDRFPLPSELKAKMKPGDKLIYLSMGTMGSGDVALMQRLVAMLAQTPHYYIVSKGLLAADYDLPENMWGEAHVPQTKVLPLVDLVITHGGNNTLTESLFNGKPILVMPLFYDQYNNAARVAEKGLGARLDPYRCTEQELIDTVNRLLHDEQLHATMVQIRDRIRKSESKVKACLAIESLVL